MGRNTSRRGSQEKIELRKIFNKLIRAYEFYANDISGVDTKEYIRSIKSEFNKQLKLI